MSTSQKRTAKKWFAAALLVPALLILTACSSLPSDLRTRSDALQEQIKTAKEAVAQQEKDFDALLQQERYAFIADYTPVQQHKDRFDQAEAKLEAASTQFEERVKQLLDGFDESERAQLETELTEVEAIVDEANTLAADPLAWAERVAETKDKTPSLIESARTASNAIVADFTLLQDEALAASQSFPAQTETIEAKVAPLEDIRDVVLSSLSSVDIEAVKTRPNFAILATGLTEIEGSSASYAEGAEILRGSLADLTVTETHTLLDLRVDSFVEISRTSWDENVDWPAEHEYDYPSVLVKPETANYFAERVNQIIGKVNPGFFSGNSFQLEAGTESARWDELKIDPLLDFPKGDNAAEFYVGEIEDTYCQQLKVLRRGDPNDSARPNPDTNYCSQYDTPSDLAKGIYWEEADEFNAEAIGMDIYSKAYGDFSDQATTVATPPGMAYVGDPATGEWREDSNGNSFWYYYGQYVFFSQLIGGPNAYHYRSEYDTWNRDYRRSNEPYYATSGGAPRYGANSPQVSSRFPNSTFVGSGLNTATVRNAGPAARAGGPGNGGK